MKAAKANKVSAQAHKYILKEIIRRIKINSYAGLQSYKHFISSRHVEILEEKLRGLGYKVELRGPSVDGTGKYLEISWE